MDDWDRILNSLAYDAADEEYGTSESRKDAEQVLNKLGYRLAGFIGEYESILTESERRIINAPPV